MRDLIVVGGGPVGLATALYADRAGLSVVVVESRSTPIDKACGEGLMPGAVAALRDLGVSPEGRPLRGIRYLRGRRSAQAHFTAGPGLGVRRTALQSCLADAVTARGIETVQATVDAVEQDDRAVHAGGQTARYLAGADGLHSAVRRLSGLALPADARPRFGLRRHFAVSPWTDLVEVHWGRDLEAYVTPVGDQLVGLALLTSRREPFEQQLRAFPELAERLGAAAVEPATTTRGAGPLRQRSRSRVSGRVLLAGDAAGYVDALTGEGVAVGLASARALVDAVAADDPAAYEQAWLRASRRYRWITESLLWTRNHRMTAALIVPGAQLMPPVFGAAVRALAR